MTYRQWARFLREHGDCEVAQCPECGLWCVAGKGQDPLLEGRAQDVLDTRPGYPLQWLGPRQHAGCADILLGVMTAEQALEDDPVGRWMLPAMEPEQNG